MRETSSKIFLIGAIASLIALSAYEAFSRPGYFTDVQLLGGVFLLEVLLLIVWRFEQRFFPLLLLVFLAAGTDVPFRGIWSSVRWIVLAFGALAGMVLYCRNYRCFFGIFHLIAISCCLSALVSAMVSNSPGASAGKAVSLILLVVFGAGGARLVICNNPKFFDGLLNGCELLVYFTTISYGVFGYEFFGNANSLGAVMGIVAMPVLLWGSLIGGSRALRIRRTFVFVLALLLCLDSYSRASISSGLISCSFLCLGFRRYRLLVKGLAIAAIAAMVVMTFRPLESGTKADSLVNAFIYKGRPDDGLLASRRTPWDETIASIQQSPWFGTGFGTSLIGSQERQRVETMRSLAGTSREHGNSYLAIAEWVGLLGVVPFMVLLVLVCRNVLLGFARMRRMNNVSELFVPICAVVLAGLVGAFFEDWMFAVGSYLCIFFWSFAFSLPDLLSAAQVPEVIAPALNPQAAHSWDSGLSVALPGR
jgi:O-antigen ligase